MRFSDNQVKMSSPCFVENLLLHIVFRGLCHMDKVAQQANILIRIRSLFVCFTRSPYLEP